MENVPVESDNDVAWFDETRPSLRHPANRPVLRPTPPSALIEVILVLKKPVGNYVTNGVTIGLRPRAQVEICPRVSPPALHPGEQIYRPAGALRIACVVPTVCVFDAILWAPNISLRWS